MGHLRHEHLNPLFTLADKYINHRFPLWQEWRRQIHAHPEKAWHEENTTAFIRQKLEESGLSLLPGPRGLGGFVNLQGDKPARLLAIRGDIDAIPIKEETGQPFASQIEGLMHACGHDVHGTVVLAVCDTLQHLLSSDQDVQRLNVRAIFQPAEEVAEGATESIAAGALEGVDRIVAMHVDSSRQVGCFGFRDGIQTACCDELMVHLTGPGGHGARPHEAGDPVFASAQFINSAYSTISRLTDPRQPLVLSFCHITGGHSANVIPTDVTIRGTLRSFDSNSRDQVFEQLSVLSESVGKSLGVTIKFQPGVSVPSVNNCPETNQLLRAAAESFGSTDSVSEVDVSLGGEDFACYQTMVPGSLVRIGSANGDHGTAHLHSPHFDVDEEVIRVACRLFVRAALQWASEEQTG